MQFMITLLGRIWEVGNDFVFWTFKSYQRKSKSQDHMIKGSCDFMDGRS